MGAWSRRELLGALAAGAATPVLLPLLGSCGGDRSRAATGPGGPRGVGDLRAQLRERVAELSADYRDVSALATLRHRGGAAVDSSERSSHRQRETAVVFAVTSGELRYEQATTDLSPDGVDDAIAQLRSRAPRDAGARALSPAAPQPETVVPLARDPARATPADWLAETDELYRRGLRVGGSRIVYRGAYLDIDDTTTVLVQGDLDRAQRLVRCRAGVLLVAWTGSAPSADEAVQAGTIGLEALDLDGDELEAAADRALARLTVRPAPEGDLAVLLDPSITGALAADALAPLVDGRAWLDGRSSLAAGQLIGSNQIGLVDDATLAGGYGSYFFDDEGGEAGRVTLIDGGSVSRPLADGATARALGRPATGTARRAGGVEPLAPVPSNLALLGGGRSRADLIGDVDRGLIAAGVRGLELDADSGHLIIRAARGMGVQSGRLSGAHYGALELRATLAGLLGDARVGGEIRRLPGYRNGLAFSSGGPYLLTRAEVRRGT